MRCDRLWLRLFGRTVGGAVGKAPVLVLHTVGRKTGRARPVPVCYLPDGDDLLVGGGSGGSERHPGWYYNLLAAPDTTVEIDGRPVPVTAALLQGDERAEAWRKLNQTTGIGYKYERRVTREIPVFRFTRRAT